MLDRLAELAPDEAVHGAWLMTRFYLRLGATGQAGARLRSLLAIEGLGDRERAKLLTRLAGVDIRLGDPGAAQRAAERAFALAEAVGDQDVLVDALSWLASLASFRGDTTEAVTLGTRALAEAEKLDAETREHALMDLGSLLGEAGRIDEARESLERAAAEGHAAGFLTWEMYAMGNLAMIELGERRFDAARAAAERTLEVDRQVGDAWERAYAQLALGLAFIGLDRRADARRVLLARLGGLRSGREVQTGEAAVTMRALALAADPRDARRAARLLGATSDAQGAHPDVDRITTVLQPELSGPLVDALGRDAWVAAEAEGRSLSFEDALELAWSLAVVDADPVLGDR